MSIQQSERPFLERHMKALRVAMWASFAIGLLAVLGIHMLREAGAASGVVWLRGLANAAAALTAIMAFLSMVAKVQRMKSPWFLIGSISFFVFLFALVGAVVLGDQPSSADAFRNGAAFWLGVIALAAFAVNIAAAFPVASKWWDEVRLRAHLDAWFWGGSVGLYFVVFSAFAIPLLQLDGAADAMLRALLASTDNAFLNAFGLGALVTIAPILLGYGVWWAVWWLRRR